MSVIILVAGLVCFSVWQLPREPVYRGEALTVWLRAYSSGPASREWREADEAVRQAGTNSIPVLLRMLRQRDSTWKSWIASLAKRQSLVRIHFVSAAERIAEASRAFVVLGDLAKDALPELIRLYDDNPTADSKAAIEDAFSWNGYTLRLSQVNGPCRGNEPGAGLWPRGRGTRIENSSWPCNGPASRDKIGC